MTETAPGELITAAEAAGRRLDEMDPAPPAIPAEGTGAAALIRVVERNPHMDIEKVREFLAMAREWEKEEARKAYLDALARAQATMPIVKKNKHVEFPGKSGKVDYWHADYGNLVKTIAPHLSREGLSFDHDIIQEGDDITVRCILSHHAGHDKSVEMSAPPDDTGGKNPIQQIKSTVKYLQRATLEAVSGAATEDDDDDGRGYGARPVEPITDEQAREIEDALVELGADRAVFLRYLTEQTGDRIEDVAGIPAPALVTARQAISLKRQKVEQEREAAIAAAAEAEDARDDGGMG